MFRLLRASARAPVALLESCAAIRRVLVLCAAGVVTAALLVAATLSPASAAGTCDRSATPSSFASELAAASAGQTVCLASGDYGTFAGTGKAVVIRAADGASPQMRIGLGSGDSGFALEGMSGMGGAIADGATNITVRNSAFTGPVNIGGSGTDGIVFDANTHNWNVGPSSGGANAKIYLENSLSGTLAAPSVTVQNSEIENGDLDGIHFGGGSGYQIVGNRLENLCDQNANHTDHMQFDTSTTSNVRIAGNYVYASCVTQGITSYDAGTSGVIIEDNVVDIRRPAGIELYADRNSIVRHNTVRFHPDADCLFSGILCGQIDINRKSEDPAGTGTQVYDNIATRVSFSGGSTGTAHHNVSGQLAIYLGPTNTYRGFALASISPVGIGTASDGLNNGIRLGANPAATPTAQPPAVVNGGSKRTSSRRMKARRRGRVVTGRLRGVACAVGARIILERRARGAWRAIARTRTGAHGRFRIRLPSRAGAYRLRVPSTAGCASARTRVFRIR